MENLELSATADEDALQPADTLRSHRRQCADETSTGHAARFSFGRNRRRLREFERARHCPGRALADQNLTRPSALLETRCNVDRVARDEGTSDAGLSRDDLTGVHADTEREHTAEQFLETFLHRKRRVQGALRVVFLSCGRAEGRHDRVAGELFDGSASVSDLSRHCVVEPIEQRARSLGVLGAGELRRAYEVSEEKSCEFPLFARLSRFRDRRTAVGAESRTTRPG